MNCTECNHEITPEIRVDVEEFKNLCYPCYKLKPKHVCVDFDGVLAEYDGWKGPENLGEPREDAAQFLREINDLGMKVIILTTRDPVMVQFWLLENGLSELVDRVTREKAPALAYISRWAITFKGDFQEITGEPLGEGDARRRATYLKPLPELSWQDWGYIGGLIDGEGYIGAGINGRGRLYLRLAVVNQHRSVLDWLCELFGGSITKGVYSSEGARFPCYTWYKSGISMKPMIEHLLQNNLLKMKAPQVELALQLLDTMRYDGRKLGSIQQLRQEQLAQALQDMNKWGVAIIQPIIIDDRAICFEGDFGRVLWKLVRFTPYWRNK
jgi:hypothetical protein